MTKRVVVVGRLWQRGEEGRLGNRQVIQRLVEVIECRCRNAIRSEAEIDFVEIKLQHSILGKSSFDAERQDRLLELTIP